jgi:hypothetical protein
MITHGQARERAASSHVSTLDADRGFCGTPTKLSRRDVRAFDMFLRIRETARRARVPGAAYAGGRGGSLRMNLQRDTGDRTGRKAKGRVHQTARDNRHYRLKTRAGRTCCGVRNECQCAICACAYVAPAVWDF